MLQRYYTFRYKNAAQQNGKASVILDERGEKQFHARLPYSSLVTDQAVWLLPIPDEFLTTWLNEGAVVRRTSTYVQDSGGIRNRARSPKWKNLKHHLSSNSDAFWKHCTKILADRHGIPDTTCSVRNANENFQPCVNIARVRERRQNAEGAALQRQT
jgi:hypothetical protein